MCDILEKAQEEANELQIDLQVVNTSINTTTSSTLLNQDITLRVSQASQN